MDINKWYSGKYDRAFKEVMLQSKNKGLLKSIIEHILDIKINELEIINSEKLMGNVHVKGQRFDLNLDTNIGNINLEVNSCDNKIVHRKNFSYICR